MVNYVAIGVIAVVIVLLIIGALDRWNVFGDDRENEASGTDRVSEEARAQDFSVSWLKKHKTLTLPAKVVAVSVGLIVLSTGVYAYFVLKNGAPVEVPYANAIQAGAIAVVGIFGGVAYRAKKDRDRGRIDIVYEDDAGNEKETDTIWYGRAETTTNTDGNLVVHEHFPTRILGLFGRRKLVVHDRELRSGRSVLSDVVAHEIPDHAVRIDDHHFHIRTQARVQTEGASKAADYRYRSPIELPFQSYIEQQEHASKLQMRLETKDAMLGEAQAQLGDLQRRMQSSDRFDRQEAREELIDLIDRLGIAQKNVEVKQDSRPERLPKDQRDVEPAAGGAQ